MTQADNQCSAIPDVDFPGNDIKTTDRANPGDCCADCLATPRCTAYNWDSGVCYLKSSQGTMSPLPGGVSGVVVKTTPAPTTVAPTTMAPTSAPTKAPTSAPTKAPTAAPTPAPTVAPSCKRIRKSWEALTAAEKDTYISAIELAMDKGMYQKFVEIHKETMSTTEAHGTCTIDIHNDPLVGEFFRAVPNQYYQFADVRGLGYSFELKGLLGDLYTKCDGSVPMAMPRTESASNATTLTIDHVVQPVTLQENLNVLSFEDAVLAQAAKQGLTRDQGFKELRKMTIMLQQNCLTGDVTDFTDEQKKMFHVQVSPSFAILSKIQSGEDPIRIDGWTDLLFKYYGCHGNVKEQ
ncbi:hypothetical protein H310_02463 [Aphanomyces invadans]|uniref:Apple domain-containing protein n=1 Tax=Aphanomyces invadans TaxID=157072 RepID=A0A024UQH4_9STRA|nr:hypothetical protein H310_02463 [Aphanomyces invadans]ETW08102.1 hypothetical protein H310_02463 [Aphanomyces invadans]|eukprot:XP_008864195.1 hypothetical protein H310_02463 [Aphanomyces invadans]